MNERREWLPDARPEAGDAYWDAYTARVVRALGPEMAARASGAGRRTGSWSREIGDRWPAAAVLAAAAVVAALLAVGPTDRASAPPAREDLTLTLLAAEGDPATLMEQLGIPADPVLAWLTLEGARR